MTDTDVVRCDRDPIAHGGQERDAVGVRTHDAREELADPLHTFEEVSCFNGPRVHFPFQACFPRVHNRL